MLPDDTTEVGPGSAAQRYTLHRVRDTILYVWHFTVPSIIRTKSQS